MNTPNLSYNVENLYKSKNGILIPNAIKFDLKLGEIKQLYANVFATLKDFYEQKNFYVNQAMALDKPTEWKRDYPFNKGSHQLWKDNRRIQKKGKILINVKEDTIRNVEKKVGYKPADKNIDYPASNLFGGREYLYDTMSVGSKPALFLFVNSFSPYYNPSQESEEDKQDRREAETLSLAHFFGDRNPEKARVLFKSDLEQIVE